MNDLTRKNHFSDKKYYLNEIVKQDVIDEVTIKLEMESLFVEVDNWILEQIRKRSDILFRYVSFDYDSRHMRIYKKK